MTSYKGAMRSIFIVLFVAAFGLGISWLAGANGAEWNGYPVFFICAAVALAVNWLAFVPAAITQSEKYYDLVGAITYLSILATACLLSGNLGLRALVVTAMVGIWCIRLGSFLFRRISKAGTDQRFDKIKVNPPRFLVAWTLQALWGILTAAAAVAIITATRDAPLGLFFWIGTLVWLFGFVFEVVADRQKGAFRDDPSNKGTFIKSGLWAWSQHPNYFGEITLWTGILIIALPLLAGWSWLVVISPIFVTLLLTKVSGIPMLDEAAKKRWGDDAAYRDYTRDTPVLIPRPPKR